MQMLNSILPKDPRKRDYAVVALIAIPLMILGVIWGMVENFSEERPPATVAPGYHPETPTASPAVFVIDESR